MMQWSFGLIRLMKIGVVYQKSILVLILFLNGILLWMGTEFVPVLCNQTKLRIPTHPDKTIVKNEDRNLFKNSKSEFNWRDETRLLAEVIPVIKHNPIKKQRKKIEKISKAQKLNPIKNLDKLGEVISLLLERYNPPITFRSVRDADDVYKAQLIFNCDDIKYLEKRTVNPVLTYGLTSKNEKKGEIRLDSGQTVDVVVKVFHKNRTDRHDFLFQTHLETFLKYLKTQGWPGIPRIYGACLLSEEKQDLSRKKNTSDYLHELTYILDRYDAETPLCKEETATESCVNLLLLRRLINNSENSYTAILKTMRGFGETFETLWRNGVFPYDFKMNDIIISQSFQVIFTNVESFIFLDSYLSEFDFRRIHSGTMCKGWQHCASPKWGDQHFIFKFGAACKETRGYCDSRKKCWGMDSMAYICIFSKWIFNQLLNFFPPTWDQFEELKNLLDCTSSSLPHQRCNWSFFLRKIEEILEKEIKK